MFPRSRLSDCTSKPSNRGLRGDVTVPNAALTSARRSAPRTGLQCGALAGRADEQAPMPGMTANSSWSGGGGGDCGP